MKRFRLSSATLEEQPITIFGSAEALYEWIKEGTTQVDSQTINLKRADFIDIEWLGCEFVFEGDKHLCLNVVNTAYVHQVTAGSTPSVQPILGWIATEVLSSDSKFDIKTLADDEGIRLPHPFDVEDDDE